MSVRLLTEKDAKFCQRTDRQIFLGDVLDPSHSDTMSVSFGRYKKRGETEWVVTYNGSGHRAKVVARLQRQWPTLIPCSLPATQSNRDSLLDRPTQGC